MSTVNALPTEQFALVATIDPATVANTELFSDVIDMSRWGQVMGVALLGNMASETIDFKSYTCDSGGSSRAALKNATQLAASASANDNTQLVINIRNEDLQTSGARYIVFGLVTGGASGGPASVVAFGTDGRFQPASDFDLASVTIRS
jgi:hypothetical protein